MDVSPEACKIAVLVDGPRLEVTDDSSTSTTGVSAHCQKMMNAVNLHTAVDRLQWTAISDGASLVLDRMKVVNAFDHSVENGGNNPPRSIGPLGTTYAEKISDHTKRPDKTP